MRQNSISRGRVRRPLATGLLALAAIGMTIGLGAAPAEAKAMSATLSIDKTPESGTGGKYRVHVDVLVPMNKYDAVGYVNNGAYIALTLFADDAGDDRFNELPVFVAGPTTSAYTRFWRNYNYGLFADAQGVHLRTSFLAPGNVLNEDKSAFNTAVGNTRDEIYYVASFVDGDGGTSKKKSNVATGYFCC